MKRKKYTDQEKGILLKNENILDVSDTNVKYCPKFKVKAVEEYNQGKSPIKIFSNAQIDIDIIGRENPERCIKRWRNTFNILGIEGLMNEQRGKGGGRPRTRELTLEEAKARIVYLEAENEFLKKLEALERGLM